jgi:hypothetical protein
MVAVPLAGCAGKIIDSQGKRGQLFSSLKNRRPMPKVWNLYFCEKRPP